MQDIEFYATPLPEDSYSRQLDKRAQRDTPPYGYPEVYYLEPHDIEIDIKNEKKRPKK